jgi:hypothetical protein
MVMAMRLPRLLLLIFLLVGGAYAQSVVTSNPADARRLLEKMDHRPLIEAIEMDNLEDLNKTFNLPDGARVMLVRHQYIHVGGLRTDYLIEIPNSNKDAKVLETFLDHIQNVGWIIYKDGRVCIADPLQNRVFDGSIQYVYSGYSWSHPNDYKTWVRFTESSYHSFFPALAPPAPCYEGILPTRRAFSGIPQLEEGSTVCSYLTLDVVGPANFEPFVYSVLLTSPENPVLYDAGECWWKANEVKVYNTILPHDIIIKIVPKDDGTANAMWNKIRSYRCPDSENRTINLPLGDEACWQPDSNYVMSAGLKILYIRYQQVIYAVAVNPYLEEDSFHMAIKLALQTMKGQ